VLSRNSKRVKNRKKKQDGARNQKFSNEMVEWTSEDEDLGLLVNAEQKKSPLAMLYEQLLCKICKLISNRSSSSLFFPPFRSSKL